MLLVVMRLPTPDKGVGWDPLQPTLKTVLTIAHCLQDAVWLKPSRDIACTTSDEVRVMGEAARPRSTGLISTIIIRWHGERIDLSQANMLVSGEISDDGLTQCCPSQRPSASDTSRSGNMKTGSHDLTSLSAA